MVLPPAKDAKEQGRDRSAQSSQMTPQVKTSKADVGKDTSIVLPQIIE
jgi:hypothetical protein